MRRALVRGALLLLGSSGALVVAECSLRVFDPLHHRERIEQRQLGDALLRRHGNQLGLTPHARGRYRGDDYVVNRHGMRGPDATVERPGDVFRILVVGDSVAFGWGVAEPQCFPRVLERLLRSHPLPGLERRVEVVNAGTPGWGVVDYFLFLRDRGLAFRPDLILVTLVHNDLPLEEARPLEFRRSRPLLPPRPLDRSFVAHLVTTAINAFRHAGRNAAFLTLAEAAPAAIDVGCASFARIRALCNDIPLVVLDTAGVDGRGGIDRLVNTLEELEILRVEAYLLGDSYAEQFAVSSTDDHPNAQAHERLARLVARALRAGRWKSPR